MPRNPHHRVSHDVARRHCVHDAVRLAIPVTLAIAACPAFGDTGRDSAADETLLGRWFATSDSAKESQPHWITPLVTVTPRLEQEFRYDQSWQNLGHGTDSTNYGGNKGLEIIPTPNTELIFGVPAYQTRDVPGGESSGWTDETLLIKYRFFSRNEEHGNAIVSGFLGASVPSGSREFTRQETILTPTLAVGKGWGSRDEGFDVQSTIGAGVPTANEKTLGIPIAWNTALQVHVLDKLWPEAEINYTHYVDGPHDGQDQLAITVGVIAGRFDLGQRVRLIVGGGYQQAVSAFRTFEHAWLFSARAAF